MNANEKLTFSRALAGGAIATALIDLLHKKGILTLDEARGVLESAMKEVGSLKSEGVYETQSFIASLLGGKFSAR